jgi:C_GCAxxG_C_C family probable redox protein
MDNGELAVSCFDKGFNCSQSIVGTYGPGLGLDRETALRLAAAFGAGVGRTGDMCGAVSGSLMVIGLKFGTVDTKDNAAKEKTYKLAQEFMSKFKDQNGSLVCKNLLGCDLSTPQGYQYAKDQKLFDTICPKYLRDAADILDVILQASEDSQAFPMLNSPFLI